MRSFTYNGTIAWQGHHSHFKACADLDRHRSLRRNTLQRFQENITKSDRFNVTPAINKKGRVRKYRLLLKKGNDHSMDKPEEKRQITK